MAESVSQNGVAGNFTGSDSRFFGRYDWERIESMDWEQATRTSTETPDATLSDRQLRHTNAMGEVEATC